MSDHRAEGVVTLCSSVSHGGEHAGTTGFLRREKIIQPDGRPTQVPVISGNAVRGLLRDISAGITFELLGRPELPLPVFDFLWSGGALAKAGAGHAITTSELRELRRLVPHVGLFGGAGGGRIIEGRVQIGKMTPICQETAHLLPAGAAGEGELPSIWDLTQIEEFTRRDDAKRPQLTEQALADNGDSVDREVAQQMRYGIQTLAAGARLHWWLAMSGVSDLEVAQLRATLGEWVRSGCHIGGRSATGHGRLHTELPGWVEHTPELTAGAGGLPDNTSLAAHFEASREEALSALGAVT